MATNQKRFFMKESTEKSELLVQIEKVSREKIKKTDQKEHNFWLTKIGKKRKARMTTIDFIIIRGQQNFEDNAETNLIDLKIQKTQNVFEKYKKNRVKFTLKRLLFLGAIKNKKEKILATTSEL